ncbi:unnamed protein product [Urochloa humidicola]
MSSSAAAAAVDDDVERRACYGVVVSCASLAVFCVVAATAGVVKAGAATGFTLLFLGVVGWFLPFGASARGWWPWERRRRSSRAAAGGAGARCSCSRGAAPGDVPPAFAYECPAAAAADADAEGSGKPGAALCAVCLENVRRREAVRRMPACGHLFPVGCVDMWLESHTTCPLCRRDLHPPPACAAAAAEDVTAAAAEAEAAAQSSSGDVLPPV